ncbi:MAG: hypothetical protein IPG52_14900 [Rhodocyclaceae bacterium]|nr:hypothetical protein [Rhodocyclaceae bacterium]
MNRAVFSAARDKALDPAGLIKHISRNEAEYLGQVPTRYRLQTSISIVRSINIPETRLGTVVLRFGKQIPKSVGQHRANLVEEARQSIHGDPPTNYTDVSVFVTARSEQEGGTRALDMLDFVRSIWNLHINRGHSWRWSSNRPAINKIFLGPIHSLHKPDGKLATESWWYDPSYVEPVDPFGDRGKSAHMLTFASKIRAKLTRHPYADQLQTAILRYGRALDSRDLHDAFLRLWGLLELLTDTSFQDNGVTVRRTAFLFADRDRAVHILTHLADRRNRYVHGGSETDRIESLLFLLKRHLEPMLLFHINNHFGFESLAETGSFLSLDVALP